MTKIDRVRSGSRIAAFVQARHAQRGASHWRADATVRLQTPEPPTPTEIPPIEPPDPATPPMDPPFPDMPPIGDPPRGPDQPMGAARAAASFAGLRLSRAHRASLQGPNA